MVNTLSLDHAHASPLPLVSPVGREGEMATARALILEDAAPLLTLIGPGGVGKTSLARPIARDAAATAVRVGLLGARFRVPVT
jgi:ATP-dependent Lon protease